MNSYSESVNIEESLHRNRRKGKVARLPKAVHDKINTMILDGVPYLEIIEGLSPDTEGLTESNLCNWKNGGYLDWLQQLSVAEKIQDKYELAQEIATRCGDDNAAAEVLLHNIASNLCQLMAETDPSAIRESLLSDADKFSGFVNVMVRLADGSIRCQLQKFRLQDRTRENARRKNPADPPGISEEALHLAEAKLKLL
jgi:hypothetical protein